MACTAIIEQYNAFNDLAIMIGGSNNRQTADLSAKPNSNF